jgi:hypothetical protein
MARQPFQSPGVPNADDLGTFAQFIGRQLGLLSRAIPRGPSTQTIVAGFTIPEGNESEHVLYRCDATAAPFTVLLPKSQTSADTTFTLKKVDASANAVTWLRQGTDTVEGATTGALAAQWNYKRFFCRTGGFDIIGG